jgi:hypothetical protein
MLHFEGVTSPRASASLVLATWRVGDDHEIIAHGFFPGQSGFSRLA